MPALLTPGKRDPTLGVNGKLREGGGSQSTISSVVDLGSRQIGWDLTERPTRDELVDHHVVLGDVLLLSRVMQERSRSASRSPAV